MTGPELYETILNLNGSKAERLKAACELAQWLSREVAAEVEEKEKQIRHAAVEFLSVQGAMMEERHEKEELQKRLEEKDREIERLKKEVSLLRHDRLMFLVDDSERSGKP